MRKRESWVLDLPEVCGTDQSIPLKKKSPRILYQNLKQNKFKILCLTKRLDVRVMLMTPRRKENGGLS